MRAKRNGRREIFLIRGIKCECCGGNAVWLLLSVRGGRIDKLPLCDGCLDGYPWV